MVQRIIDIFPTGLQTVDSANFRLKVCLEPFAIYFLLQTPDLNLHAAEYFEWSQKDAENPTQIIHFLKQNSKLFNVNQPPTVIYFRNEDMMILPRELAINAKELLQVQFGFKANEGFLQRNINDEITIAWKINAIWAEVFTSQYSGHTSRPSIRNLFLSATFNGPETIYITFGNGLVEVIVVFKQKLQLAKCFSYKTIYDLEYHLLNICSQLSVQPTEVTVQLQGFIAHDSSLYRSLQTFFADVQTINADNTNWIETLKALPAHYFTALIQAV